MTKTNHIITLSKHQLRDHVKRSIVSYGFFTINKELTLCICSTDMGIINAIFCNQTDYKTRKTILDQYPLKREYTEHKLLTSLQEPRKLVLVGTPFQIQVWQELLNIPVGATQTYQEIAKKINRQNSHRAVANAIAANTIAYFIPCHRVIRKDNSLGGYRWGTDIKQRLLHSEFE